MLTGPNLAFAAMAVKPDVTAGCHKAAWLLSVKLPDMCSSTSQQWQSHWQWLMSHHP